MPRLYQLILSFFLSSYLSAGTTPGEKPKGCPRAILKPGGSMAADGIYGAPAIRAIRGIEKTESGPLPADANVFDWYENILPPAMNGVHVIDWGAGWGRFVETFRKRSVAKISLIEPSEGFIKVLREKFSIDSDIEISQANVGATVPRIAKPTNTVHICNFVVNCLPDPKTAFDLMANAVLPGEHLYLVTNIFVPKAMASAIADPSYVNSIPFSIEADLSSQAALPTAKRFTNKIISTGQSLSDVVHTSRDYAQVWQTEKNRWKIDEARLTLPDGFEHIILSGEDFGDYRFAVLVMKLERK